MRKIVKLLFFLLNAVQILVYLYSLAGLGLQYLNLYRSVWWLPHRCSTGTATSNLTWYSEVSGTLRSWEFGALRLFFGNPLPDPEYSHFLDPDSEPVD